MWSSSVRRAQEVRSFGAGGELGTEFTKLARGGKMNLEASDEELLSRIITFEPPPPGFNSLTASHHLLRRYGYPHRPDPDKEPRLSKLWLETLSRPHRMITAELRVDHSKLRRMPLRSKAPSFSIGGQWAGAEVDWSVLGLPADELINSVYAQWRVPTVTLPNSDTAVGFWVGIGGDQYINSNQLIQAGVEAVPQQSGSDIPAYRAWTQWWPEQPSAITVSNFPVSPGDLVGVLVLMPHPDYALFSMLNYNTNTAVSVGITGPDGVMADGSSAEWCVEGNGDLLAHFTGVAFSGCVLGTKNHEFGLEHARPLQIFSPTNSNEVLATPPDRPLS
jgi:hypothetical protein